MNEPADMVLRVVGRRALTPSIAELALQRDGGGVLPDFEPGAHITVETPAGAMRRYSLVNDGKAPAFYVIAVKREPGSRGGSRSMHDGVAVGSMLRIEPPQNGFPLGPGRGHLLIAAGIGITPILAMARRLQEECRPFRLIYLTRTPEETAYRDAIAGELGEHVTFHHDGGDPANAFDFWDLLEKPGRGHVYCCGPAPLIEDIKGMTGHWPEGRVHFEDFNPVEVVRPGDRAFSVRLAATGCTVDVPADRSILEALRDAGLGTVSSCESGTCGTCRARLVSGDVEHRDMVLTDDEKSRFLMICVSRAAQGDLVVDL